MSFIIPEKNINIGEDVFHGNCVLGRAASGEKLSELVEKINQPVVIAVDGPWGSGKSHFLKLWTGAHKKDNGGKAKVIYFDAFKHDYFDDPLVALVGQIFEEFSEGKAPEGKMKTLLKQAGRLVKPATRIALAAATGFASEALGAAAASGTNALGKEAENALDPVWENEANRRAAMEKFKTALKDLTIENGTQEEPQKIVIIIDELDRCRPDFALSMLEIIKHFFAVENVTFVLGVNLAELENSVKARYGGETNAAKYLQKFIQIKFRVNEVAESRQIEHATVEYFDHMSKTIELPNSDLLHVVRTLIVRKQVLKKMTLRDVEQLLTILSITPKIIAGRPPYSQISIVAGLLVLKVLDPRLLMKARLSQLSIGDINKVFDFDPVREIPRQQFPESTQIAIWRAFTDQSFLGNGPDELADVLGKNNNPIDRNAFIPLLISRFVDTVQVY